MLGAEDEEEGMPEFSMSSEDADMEPLFPRNSPTLKLTSSKTCGKCASKFSNLSLFYRHRYQCQKSFGGAYCWCCRRGFGFRSLFLNHRCSRAYRRKLRNRRQLQKNLAEARSLIEEKVSPVEEADEDAPAEEEDDEDMEEDRSRDETPERDLSITCPKCKDKFSTPKFFQYHIVHNLCIPEISICKICNREFDDVEELNFHQKRCEEKQRMIEKLKEKYDRMKKLEKSRKKRDFSCRACRRRFPMPQLLKEHLDTHSRCIRIHNMKIKLKCFWERGGDLRGSARKSFSNYKTGSSGVVAKSLKRSDSPAMDSWDSLSSSSGEERKTPVVGAARKSFRSSSQTNDAGGSFCDVCYRYFSSSVALKLHKSKHYENEKTVTSNKCPECSRSFEDISSLRSHQNKMDHWGKATKSMNTRCACPFCDREFTHAHSRAAHLKTHLETYPEEVTEFMRQTTCSLCFQVFGTEELMIQHVRLTHGSQFESDAAEEQDHQQYNNVKQDSDADKMFKTHKYVGYSNKNVLVNVTPSIEKQLKSNPNQCPICLRHYSTSFIRNRHFRTHTLDQAFECKFCPTKFPRSDRLMQHMQQEHNDYLAYECKQCGLRFTTRMRALQHGNKVHPRQSAKSLIKERNVSFSSLNKKNHKSPSSTNEAIIPEEEFYCDVCELSFLKLCGLQRHRQSKLHLQILEKSKSEKAQLSLKAEFPVAIPQSPEQRPPMSTTPPFIDYSKKFCCSTCQLEFDSVNDFVPHRLSHFSMQNYGNNINESNPYSCEICNKVMDNHQKIQLHLFWHLQDVQLQAGSKKAGVIKVESPERSEKLKRHPVAKKSSSSKIPSKSQELVIAGVKKPLFTCEACHIGFTTEHHYSVHVARYCRMQKQEVEDKNGKEPEKGSVTAGFCKICGCIFSSSSLYEEHKTLFCNKNTYLPLNENPSSLYTEMVKSLMKLDTMVAGCVRCNLAFDSMQALSEHSARHVVQKDAAEPSSSLENVLLSDDKPLSICIESDGTQPDAETNEVPDTVDSEEVNKSENTQIVSSVDSGEVLTTDNSSSDAVDESSSTITTLRNNFSRLLCVLVSDQELMEQLGYGKSVIDEVLVNVLNQMGLVPVPADEVCTTLDRLRRNIRILLDVCIKDQIMELIADGEASTENIVSAALKMFEGEEVQPEPST